MKYSLKKHYSNLIKEYFYPVSDEDEDSLYPLVDTDSNSGDENSSLFQVFFPPSVKADDLKGKTFIYNLEDITKDTTVDDIKALNATLKSYASIGSSKRISQQINNAFVNKGSIKKNDSYNNKVKQIFKNIAIEAMKEYLVCLSMINQSNSIKSPKSQEEFIFSNMNILMSSIKTKFEFEINEIDLGDKNEILAPLHLPTTYSDKFGHVKLEKDSNTNKWKVSEFIGEDKYSYGGKRQTAPFNIRGINPKKGTARSSSNKIFGDISRVLLTVWVNRNDDLKKSAYKYVFEGDKTLAIVQNAIGYYTTENIIAASKLLNIEEQVRNKLLRRTYFSPEAMCKDFNSSKIVDQTLDFVPSNRIGKGELAVHLFSKTLNPCLEIEPDAIIEFTTGGPTRCSIKSFMSGNAQSGTNQKFDMMPFLNLIFSNKTIKEKLSKNLKMNDLDFKTDFDDSLLSEYKNYYDLYVQNPNNTASQVLVQAFGELKIKHENLLKTYTKDFIELKTNYSLDLNSHKIVLLYESKSNFNRIRKRALPIKTAWDNIKREITKEHETKYVICISDERKWFYVDNERIDPDQIQVSGINEGRASFKIFENKSAVKLSGFENNISRIDENINSSNNLLKEVYSHLFKKKIINEGGLAGHMMHPYEALDMTPRQIIDRIKEYSTSQSIIEKVDGQNLFFTVEQDGTLMFARNKQDMTHEDLVTKFKGHGAEKPFTEGGDAIKSGVEQWIQSAGDAAEMEIREIFHPTDEIKSFINFEIMHPEKENQIIYDEKYIVFHSIIDYVDGRKTIYTTNKGQRLEKLIRLMSSGITASGFTLASNRTVNLNELTNVQIEDYVKRIKEISQQLDITEVEFIGNGVEKQIKKEIDREGVNISNEAIKILYDFALYGESRSGDKIKSKDFTSLMPKEDAAKLRSIGLTNATKTLKKVQHIISPFKGVFVDLGIDLLRGVKSVYMSDETNQMNIDLLKEKLETAIDDLVNYMEEVPEDSWDPVVHRLQPHLDKVMSKGINSIVSTSVEGGVYDHQGDLIKVTGGFAPLNQILGAAYRDNKGIFVNFKVKYKKNESRERSLKSAYKILF